MNPYPYGNQPSGYPTPYPVNYVPSANPIGFQGVQHAPNFGQHAMNPPIGAYGNSMASEPFYPSYPNYPMGNNQPSYSSPPVAPIPSSHQQFGGCSLMRSISYFIERIKKLTCFRSWSIELFSFGSNSTNTRSLSECFTSTRTRDGSSICLFDVTDW